MRYFAIGDIHGHFDELNALLDKLMDEAAFNLGEDHLVLLGDLVDNGPKSKEVLDLCIAWKQEYPDTFHPLKGNHDDLLLDALNPNHPKYGDYYLWWNQGGRQTLESYTRGLGLEEYEKAISQPKDYIPAEHIEFLLNLPTHLETDDYFFVHAGIRPGVSLEQQQEEDLLWIRAPFYNSPETFPKTIVFAHTSFEDHTNMDSTVMKFEVMNESDRIGINTMPRNLGYLTCVELPERNFYKQEKL